MVETVHAYQTKLTIPTLESLRATATATLTDDSVTSISIVGGGGYYTEAPLVTIYDSSQDSVAIATATISGGQVSSITITDGGSGYTTIPIVTIATPTIVYEQNEEVRQINGSYTMIGEVADYDAGKGTLYISHAGADDGQFHSFATGIAVVGQINGANLIPTAVGENLQDGAQNQYFDSEKISFIDFSESNPFGDP